MSMRSWFGQGSVFSIVLDKAEKIQLELAQESKRESSNVSHLRVLCVDNEPDILVGMDNLLSRWGCDTRLAGDIVESLKMIDDEWIPDVIFSDYRLDDGRTGLEVLQQCRLRLGHRFKGVIISADRTHEVVDGIKANGFDFVAKPVKPLKLRALLNQMV